MAFEMTTKIQLSHLDGLDFSSFTIEFWFPHRLDPSLASHLCPPKLHGDQNLVIVGAKKLPLQFKKIN